MLRVINTIQPPVASEQSPEPAAACIWPPVEDHLMVCARQTATEAGSDTALLELLLRVEVVCSASE